MTQVKQLIGEFEMSYPDKGSVDGLGKYTEYFYSDYEIEHFKRFEMGKVLSKNDGTMTYVGKVRDETIADFKRDGLKWKCVSSYE